MYGRGETVEDILHFARRQTATGMNFSHKIIQQTFSNKVMVVLRDEEKNVKFIMRNNQ